MRHPTRRLGNRYLRRCRHGFCARRSSDIMNTNIRILLLHMIFNTVNIQLELCRKQYRWRVQIASCAHSECTSPYLMKAAPTVRGHTQQRWPIWAGKDASFISFVFLLEYNSYLGKSKRIIKWVCSSNGRVIPSQGIGNGIDARLIQLFFFYCSCWIGFIMLIVGSVHSFVNALLFECRWDGLNCHQWCDGFSPFLKLRSVFYMKKILKEWSRSLITVIH